MLLSDLVVPVLLAEPAEQRSEARFGARLADRTWLRPDLVVARREQFADGYVTGTPQLVVEVASAASLDRDLGAKRELWARYGLPSYWVVRIDDEDLHVHVFELDGDELVERVRLSRPDVYWATEPFKIELSPAVLFPSLPSELAANWRGTMPKPTPGADLPPADEDIRVDAFAARWPTGVEKTELEDGCPVFYGAWDDRDVEIAERAYPGRTVRLDQPAGQPGTLRVLPASRRALAAVPRALVKIEVPGDV